MSDIEPYREVTPDQWAFIAEQARTLATSDIIPAAYKGKPANIVAAALRGRDFGWGLMASMANGNVIQGTYQVKPEAMLGLIRRHGHSVVGETSNERAWVRGKRADSGDELEVAFTIEDAKTAKLDQKDNWKQYAPDMLWARAVGRLARRLFPDLTLGALLEGDVDFELDHQADGVTAAATGENLLSGKAVDAFREKVARFELDEQEVMLRITNDPERASLDRLYASEASTFTRVVQDMAREAGIAKAKARNEVEVEAEVVEEPPPAPPPHQPTEDKPITEAQQRRMRAMLNKLGIKTRAEILSLLSGVLGRPIESSAVVLSREATSFMDRLQEVEDGKAEVVIGGGEDGTLPVNIAETF